MAECEVCGQDQNMPYECKRCGGTFCVEHRLPESHDCPGLNAWSGSEGDGMLGGTGQGTSSSRQSQGPITVGSSAGLLDRLPVDLGPGGLGGYVRNNVTFVFLLAMWVVFAIQALVLNLVGVSAHQSLFVLDTQNPLYVWTYVTSIFAHAPLRPGQFGAIWHIAFNSLVLYFFGPILERRIGSKRFAAIFLVAGVLAGVVPAWTSLAVGAPYAGLGASGAVLGVLGVLTILNPDLTVMLLIPPIPMPLWVLTLLIALVSAFFVGIGAPGAGGIGHAAHLVGLLVGLSYGKKLKEEGVTAPQQLRMGGGPGGPGGGLGGGRRGGGRF